MKLFLSHLLNDSSISIDDCFNRSETLTCLNHMICLGYFFSYVGFQKKLPLNYALYVVVQWIQVWGDIMTHFGRVM